MDININKTKLLFNSLLFKWWWEASIFYKLEIIRKYQVHFIHFLIIYFFFGKNPLFSRRTSSHEVDMWTTENDEQPHFQSHNVEKSDYLTSYVNSGPMLAHICQVNVVVSHLPIFYVYMWIHVFCSCNQNQKEFKNAFLIRSTWLCEKFGWL